MASMKKILDEQTKHRLIGLIAVFALMIIFLPAMMRSTDKNFDELIPFKIPKKPPMPKISYLGPKEMFRSVKASPITLAKPSSPKPLDIAQAQPISPVRMSENRLAAAQDTVNKLQISEQKSIRFNEAFRIQLASFSSEINAQSLVETLRAQGFDASKQVVTHPNGLVYQVLVGKVKHRSEAIDLQKKLVDNTKLNGLIVKTKVI